MADETLAAAQRAAGDHYDVLAALGSDAEGHALFLARVRSSGQMLALRQRERPDGTVGFDEVTPPAANGGEGAQTAAAGGLWRTAVDEAATGTGEAPQTIVGAMTPPAAASPAGSPTQVEPSHPAASGAASPLPTAAGAAAEGGAPRVCPQCGVVFGPSDRFCPTDGSTLLAQASARGLVGQVLARRYEIRRLLGEGGMGQVYLAEQIKMRRACALKVMHAEQMHDADAAGRFGREAYNASRIINPHVAAIYDFGETDDGRLYIAMEYVDGAPLSELLRREQRLPIPRAVDIARQIADALGAAHELNIVHRDLKPDNVMMTISRSGRDVVKVVDFGIAKAVQTEGQQITRTGFIVGTPAYMSPEQITGEPLDGRSDLYALGCILFKMLTGAEPFTGQGQAMLMRRLGEPPPDPRSLNSEIPPALASVVLRVLARAAADRYPTADAFGEALAAGMTQAPVLRTTRGLWSELRARLAWLSGRTSGASPERVAPVANGGAHMVTPPSPALAQPRLRSPNDWSDHPAGAPAGQGLAPAHSPVGVADAERSPAAQWRIRVEPTNPQPAVAEGRMLPASGLPAPTPGLPVTRSVVVPTAIGATALLLVAAVLIARRPHPTAPDRVTQSAPTNSAQAPPLAATGPHANRSPKGEEALSNAGAKTPNPPDSLSASAAARAVAVRRFSSAETSALEARERAVASGATATELARGDSLRTRADNLAISGQYPGATTTVSEAASGWKAAQRAAESGHTVAQGTATGASAPTPSPVRPPAESTAAPSVSAPLPSTGLPATPGPAGPGGGSDVRSVLTAYVAAVNAREMAEMRRIWPAMPDDAAHNWQSLFNAATDLRVTLVSVDPPTLNGSRAQTLFAYTITGFVPSQGAIPSSTLRFKVKLERDAFGWRVVSMDRQK